MTQSFKDINHNTEISEGLNRILERDLTTASRSASNLTYPEIPVEDQVFDNFGEKKVYSYKSGEWKLLWDYEYGSPYTEYTLRISFEKLNQNETALSNLKPSDNSVFYFPQNKISLDPSVGMKFFSLENNSQMKNYLGLGELSERSDVGSMNIEDNSIPQTAFNLNLETDIPRVMRTGDIKRSFSTDYDQEKWVVADGGSIGNQYSTAKHKGDKFKNLFLFLGGTQDEWSSGKTINLPNYDQSDNRVRFVTEHSSEENVKTTMTKHTWFYELGSEVGKGNYATFRIIKDGSINFELIGSSGILCWDRWKGSGKDNVRAATFGGGGYAKGKISVKEGSSISAIAGAFQYTPKVHAEASTISVDGELIVRANGGKYPLYTRWENIRGGDGGDVEVLNAEKCTIETSRKGCPGEASARIKEKGVPAFVIFGGASGDPLNQTFSGDGDVYGIYSSGLYYAGNYKYVTAYDQNRVGSGSHGSHASSYIPKYGGYFRFEDVEGVLDTSGELNASYCYFLIKL